MAQQWEYILAMLEVDADHINARLNQLGADGWELVAVYNGAMFFKRPKSIARGEMTLERKVERED